MSLEEKPMSEENNLKEDEEDVVNILIESDDEADTTKAPRSQVELH